jgi:putative ABC transport system substrate-binding protein
MVAIPRGGSAADLPIHPPTSYELIVSLRAARALGLNIPPSLLLRADHVIE